MEVLIIEDEAVLGKALDRGLREAGHDCTWVRSGKRGLELAMARPYDAVVLDRLLPDVEGLDLLRTLREEKIQTPVLMLTALGSVDERVLGLQSGADDYLVKPFAFPELLARLEALGRRAVSRPSPILQVGHLRLDLSTRRVTWKGSEVDLSPTEFSILEYLMRYAGQVVTRKMLSEHVWDEDWNGVTNVIDVHINRIRGKMDRVSDQPLIHTVRGRGYVLRSP